MTVDLYKLSWRSAEDEHALGAVWDGRVSALDADALARAAA